MLNFIASAMPRSLRLPQLALALVLPAVCCLAQEPAPPPQLSPQAAYDQATHPLEVVRKSMGNWSDSELSALAVAIKNSAAACAARQPEQFSGDDLIAYARLCSLGQDWNTMGLAASQYIASTDAAKPQLALAYGLKLESDLHSRELPAIMATAKALLAGVPYDATADQAINEALDYLQLAFTPEARELAGQRQPILIAAIKSDKPPLPRHLLYEDGLAKAALEQYSGMVELASATVEGLDAALPANLPPDDAIPIATARRRYDLLGKPLPSITYTLALYDLKGTPHINPDMGVATALLVFPEWCAQCVRIGSEGLGKAIARISEHEVHLYALLAEAAPTREAKDALLAEAHKPTSLKKPAAPDPEAPAPTPAMLLLRTPTLVVPPETLATLAAPDFPFLVMLDHAGLVRFAGPAPESVLEPGDFLDRLWQHVAQAWPRPHPGPPVVK